MKFDVKAQYPAPSAVVMKMFCDKDFHTRKLDKLGLGRHRVLEHKADAASFRIRIERKVPMAPPGIVARFIPAEATVISDETWNPAQKTGRVKVEPAGIPVEIAASVTMADKGAESVIIYAFDVRAKVPLVGGALEKFIAADMEKKMADEAKAAIALLDPYR